MTVISRPQQACLNYTSNNNSDTESLNLGSAAVSDSESLHNEAISSTGRNLPLRAVVFKEDTVTLKKTSGKKKTRRYLNRCLLQALAEEDEVEEVPRLIEHYKSPFERLLEDENALEFWNDFIERPEDEQNVIMKSLWQKQEKGSEKKPDKVTSPFARISAKIKRTLKVKRKLAKEVLAGMEKEMIEFFKDAPDGIYVKKPSNSFERLLLHAIAQYHNLNSISVLTDNSRIVEVQNENANWTPADTSLGDVVS